MLEMTPNVDTALEMKLYIGSVVKLEKTLAEWLVHKLKRISFPGFVRQLRSIVRCQTRDDILCEKFKMAPRGTFVVTLNVRLFTKLGGVQDAPNAARK